jgi:hypothetical protein
VNERNLKLVRVQLEGPLRELSIEAHTRVQCALQAGESGEFVLPALLESADGRPRVPRLSFAQDEPGLGRARFVALESAAGTESAWPPGLALRPLPELAVMPVALGPAAWAMLVAATLCVLACRRVRWAMALAVLSGALVWVWNWPREQAVQRLRVYEGTFGSELWIQRELGVGQLECRGWADSAAGLKLDVEPASARAQLSCGLSSAAPLRIETPLWRSAQIRLQRLLVGELPALRLAGEPEEGTGPWVGPALARVWRRSEGAWSFHGAWERDQALPAAVAGPTDSAWLPPPGGLVQGLPQGFEVLVGELAEDPGIWIRVY